QGALSDAPRIVGALSAEKIGAIIHTAAMSHPDLLIDLPITTVAANIDGTIYLLEAAKLAGVKRIVNFSSETIYGHVDGPITEQTPPAPTTPYGVTKVATEMFARVYNALYGTKVVSLRISEIYGPGNKMPQILRDILKTVLTGHPFTMPTGADHRSHFTHGGDVGRAAIAAVDCAEPPADVYNITGGGQWSLKEAVAIIENLVPKSRIEIGPGYWHLDRQGPWDISAAARDLGYRPAYTLEEGLKTYRDWLTEHEY